MTSCMSSMRSNQLSYASVTNDIIPHPVSFVKRFSESFSEKFATSGLYAERALFGCFSAGGGEECGGGAEAFFFLFPGKVLT